MKRLLILAACAAAMACSSGSGGGSNSDGTVSGTLDGPSGAPVDFSSIVEGDSVTYSGTLCGGSEAATAVAVALATRGGVCSGFENGDAVASANVLFLSIFGEPASSGSAAPSIAAATYSLSSTNTDASGNIFAAAANVSLYDSTCAKQSVSATAGTITITSVSGGVVEGSYDVTFSSAGELTGTFDAPACSLTQTQFCSVSSVTGCSG